MIRTFSKREAKHLMNEYGGAGIPFLFIIDFELKRPIVLRIEELDDQDIRYDFHAAPVKTIQSGLQTPSLERHPVGFERYKKAFEVVQDNIQAGNTYLTNLTFPTLINTSYSLLDIYNFANAKYKLWLRDQFTVFSPEPFVSIKNGKIASFPMKGTIDAAILGAADILLHDLKEKAEHATIVDLIRNDLNRVAVGVGVERYRYFEKVKTGTGELIQSSSHISGELPGDYQHILGDIFFELLPAGSISGAPKKKTVEIIKSAEPFPRGYYTGVFGIFDGKSVESSVAIRFIEKKGDALYYKSGGGITTFSDVEAEYKELIDKVYLPIQKHVTHEQVAATLRNH
jgi:para-aminobenzoate synthetase component 1